MTSTSTAGPQSSRCIDDLDTPFALVDRKKCQRNVDRLRGHLDSLGVELRPHVKTSKSVEAAKLISSGRPCPITVSTLAEAEAFAEHGYTDMIYAVGITQTKLRRVRDLRIAGVDLTVLVDNVDQAQFVADTSRAYGDRLPALIEVDCDGHRGGVRPDSPELGKIAATLTPAAEIRGVLVHAGESYNASSAAEISQAAEVERTAAVEAAERLRGLGFESRVVSVGSTPTAHGARNLDGVTEVRAGNFIFFDLVMAGLGVCALDDIALNVVVTVIGNQPSRGWLITDGGWTATSQERGTLPDRDWGLGLVATVEGELLPDLCVRFANQEHGIITRRDRTDGDVPRLPIGTRLRVLPVHACATANQFQVYHVIDGSESSTAADSTPIIDTWSTVTGW